MSDSIFGVLRVFTFVSLPTGEYTPPRLKKVTLAKIHCSYADAKARLEEFREANSDIHVDILAHFEFRKFIGA